MKKVKLLSTHTFEKIFNKDEIALFSDLSEDCNPIHIDEHYAANTIFKKNVVHGVLLLSMFSKIFGTIYPGNGGIYLNQSAKFLKPAFVGEKIKAKVTLIEFDNIRKRGVFKCESFNMNGDVLLIGEAKILFPNEFILDDAN